MLLDIFLHYQLDLLSEIDFQSTNVYFRVLILFNITPLLSSFLKIYKNVKK